jgi:hypothetical protein
MIRDIGSLRWKDPLAWMEPMKGNSWLRVVKKENLHFKAALEDLSGNYENEFIKARSESALKDVFQSDSIYITPNETYSYLWRWKDKEETYTAAAICSHGDRVWAVEEDKEGKEIYMLSCYSKKERIWHYKTSIAPYICVSSNICYVLEATSELRYGRCVCLDAKTGGGRRILYTEPSLRTNLALVGGEGGCVFLRSDRSGSQALYHIEGTSVKRIGEECVSFVPVGYGRGSKDPCFFGRIATYASPWSAFGESLELYHIPKDLREYGIDFFSLANSLLITSAGGVRNVYVCHPNKMPEKMNKIIGTVYPDVFSKGSSYIAKVPGSTPSIYDMNKCILQGKKYASFTLEKTASKVPYILVKSGGKAKGLLVSIYGAYGIPTNLDTTRWRPYIEAGWAVAIGLIRGGGDFGAEWADAARASKKGRSIEDTEDVIRTAQKYLEISWKKTCIYGRSAGGYTLGALIAQYGSGGLIGAAYTEVPYVDILRTATNPSLPLTILEYEEFGNPVEKLEDLETILRFSPVDSLPDEGAPAIFVVARTSLNDREVLPYETVKWITHLRGYPKLTEGSAEKFLAITNGHGHFVRGSTSEKQKSEDFLLLSSWLARV